MNVQGYVEPATRINMTVEVAKQIIQTAPHVAHGTEDFQELVRLAYEDVLDKLPYEKIRGRSPSVPHFANVLPVIEGLGKLTVLRDPNARNQGAAYTEFDHLSVSGPDEPDRLVSAADDVDFEVRMSLREWDEELVKEGAKLVVDSIVDGVDPEVNLGEAIMAAVGAIIVLDVHESEVEQLKTVNEILSNQLAEVFESPTFGEAVVAEDRYAEGYRAGFKDGFTDGRAV
jgi:hypothetical protein